MFIERLQLLTAMSGPLLQLPRQRRLLVDRRSLVLVTLGMGTAWLMLFGPSIEHPTYVFLAPVLAWAAVQGVEWKPGRWLLVPALVLILILGWGALTEPFQEAAVLLAPSRCRSAPHFALVVDRQVHRDYATATASGHAYRLTPL